MSSWFQLSMNPWELIVRGSVMYVAPDMLFIVLVADASQNAMAGDYRSIGDAAVLVGTLIAWNLLLDWLAFRSPRLRRLVEPAPLPLIKDGEWMRANLKRAWITSEEVLSKLRERGIEDIAGVRRAYLEPGGESGVIRNDEDKKVRR
jgi:uncharacterized membrane protein YcaP (DUF421 family)